MSEMTIHKQNSRHAAAAPGRRPRPWPLIVIAAPAAVAIWSGWVGLGGMCGFGPVNLLPGIGNGFFINTAITLPIGVEAYGTYGLKVWLNPETPESARAWARRSAIGALILGALGQVIFHLLAAAGASRAPWPVVVLVSCMPVATVAFAAALWHLTHAGAPAAAEAAESTADEAIQEPEQSAVPEAIQEPPASAIPEPVQEPVHEAAAEPLMVPLEEPAAVPPHEPRRRAARPSKDPDAEKARKAYRESVRAGTPLSDRALGDKYGRSRTWGANRIKEVEGGPLLAAAGSE